MLILNHTNVQMPNITQLYVKKYLYPVHEIYEIINTYNKIDLAYDGD